MRKLFVFVSFLLLISLSSCTFVGKNSIRKNNDTTTTTEYTQETEAPLVSIATSINDFVGIWYCYDDCLTFHITSSQVTAYEMTYYIYEYLDICECTIQGFSNGYLNILLDTHELSLGYTGEFVFLEGDQCQYEKKDEVPTEYIHLEFPDFEKYAKNYTVTDIDPVIKKEIQDYIYYENLTIFDTIYSSYEEANKPHATKTKTEYGDYINFNYSGTVQGETEPLDGAVSENQTICLYENSGYLPDFTEGIIGHDVGETFDINVVFPESYGTHPGETIVFTITINYIYDTTFTDEQIQAYSSNAEATYDSYIKETIDSYQDTLIEYAIKKVLVYDEIPEESYAFFVQYYKESFYYQAWYYGYDYDTLVYLYYSQYGYDISDSGIASLASDNAKYYISVYAVTSSLSLDISDGKLATAKEEVIQENINEQNTEEDVREYYNSLSATELKEIEVEHILTAYLRETYFK